MKNTEPRPKLFTGCYKNECTQKSPEKISKKHQNGSWNPKVMEIQKKSYIFESLKQKPKENPKNPVVIEG